MKYSKAWSVLGILFVGILPLGAQGFAADKFEANWESLKHYRCPEWFRDAKFGIFIHWGPYSVPATYSEKYPRAMYSKGTKHRETNELMRDYHRRVFGHQGLFGYKDFIPQFEAQKFDASKWAALFHEAGARYVVPVGEHHDGFAMYNSRHTQWNAVNMGPKRDIVGELKDAAHKLGMKFGVSTHFANHWRYYEYEEGFDTLDPENSGLYGKPHDREAPPNEEFLHWWWMRVIDIIDQYQPDLLWFDYFSDTPAFHPFHPKIAAYYYNRAQDWNKEVVLNDKNMRFEAYPEEAIVLDIERGKMDHISEYPWQTDTSIGENSWGYVSNWKSKSPNTLIDDLVDIVSKNGCLLLNIGPMADGTIPQDQVKVLKEIGGWLSANGKAIYGTRPWKVYGEGPTGVHSGHHSEQANAEFTPQDIRFTSREGRLYAIALDRPESGSLEIRSLGSTSGYLDQEVAEVRLVSNQENLHWTQGENELRVDLPKGGIPDYAIALEIEFK